MAFLHRVVLFDVGEVGADHCGYFGAGHDLYLTATWTQVLTSGRTHAFAFAPKPSRPRSSGGRW
jgi:hypothetical protein